MDLYGVDLNLLVAFDALIAERSVTKAGRRIGRTQPAMSAALARLRSLFDDQLFVRGQDGLHPTPRALELAEPLGRALEEIGRTLDLSQQFDPAAYRGTLTVGLQEHAAMKLLPGLLSCLKAQAPDAKLDARVFRPRSDALAMLDAGEVDVSVSVPPQAAPGRIFTHPAFEERFVCVVRRDHPCVGESLSLDTFLTLQHLLVSPEGDRFGHTDTMLAERGLKRDLSVTVTQMYAAPRGDRIVRPDRHLDAGRSRSIRLGGSPARARPADPARAVQLRHGLASPERCASRAALAAALYRSPAAALNCKGRAPLSWCHNRTVVRPTIAG